MFCHRERGTRAGEVGSALGNWCRITEGLRCRGGQEGSLHRDGGKALSPSSLTIILDL